MNPPVRRQQRASGLTLVEKALLISLGGIVLAVSIPTFIREMRHSKTAEAAAELERLHKAAATYYATPHETDKGLALRCLPAAAGPTPAVPSLDPAEVDFLAEATPGASTWQALGFTPGRAIRFRYSFIPRDTGCGLYGSGGDEDDVPFLILRAEADLDGDGEFSVFERTAHPTPEGTLIPDGALTVRNRVE